MTSIAQLIKASDYACTGRYPIQARVVFLNELSISLSLCVSLCLCVSVSLFLFLYPYLIFSHRISLSQFVSSLSFIDSFILTAGLSGLTGGIEVRLSCHDKTTRLSSVIFLLTILPSAKDIAIVVKVDLSQSIVSNRLLFILTRFFIFWEKSDMHMTHLS